MLLLRKYSKLGRSSRTFSKGSIRKVTIHACRGDSPIFICPRALAADREHTGEGSKPQRRALFVSPVWPEVTSSAAGVRTDFLIDLLLKRNWQVAYYSYSKTNEHTQLLTNKGCKTYQFGLNKEEDFKNVVLETKPQLCIFDRSIAEEAFSFRVREFAPDCLRVLDLQDLHFWRRARQKLSENGASLEKIFNHVPELSEDCLRELAAIFRSDLALVCSPKELELLDIEYQIPRHKLQLASFFVENEACDQVGFEVRKHFVTIGNFRHPPNLDSVKWLKYEIWPLIQQNVPDDTDLHIYGSYGNSPAVLNLNDKKSRFLIKGQLQDIARLKQYRVMLAPLRFGAGLKGKIVDGWRFGLPCVTTPIGSEGLLKEGYEEDWGGNPSCLTPNDFASEASDTYVNEEKYSRLQTNGFLLLKSMFDATSNGEAIMDAIERKLENIEEVRKKDVVGNVLFSQGLRATEYFSRWIELKESINQKKA